MCVYTLCVCLVPIEFRIGVRSPGTGVTDSCELSCGCWELKLSPLEEQQSFQPLKNNLSKNILVLEPNVEMRGGTLYT